MRNRENLRADLKLFLQQARKLSAYDLDLLVRCERTQTSDFGLVRGQLTEKEAVTALQSLLSKRARKRDFLNGVALGGVPVPLLLWLLEKFGG